MATKKRKYLEDYIEFGLVSLLKGDTEVPQCVICHKTLSNDAMRPSRLKRHLATAHSVLADKPKAFFVMKSHSLKKAKLDMSGTFQQRSSNVVEASYEIAMLIAKNKKSHNIGESLVKPSIIVAAELVLGKDKANMLSQIALSNDTVKGRIDELSQDIKDQLLNLIKESLFFSIQCDEMTEMTNIGSCSQLLLYARFLSVNTIKEEMLFCRQMKGRATSAEIFNVVANFFQENKLSWESLAAACTDGAPAMTGQRSGFIKRVKEKNSSIIGTHCVLHREALASRTMPHEMKEILDLSIEIVNCIKAGSLNSRLFKLVCQDMESEHVALLFHTNVRWLSKGNMLKRLHELKEEVAIFLDSRKKRNLLEKFQSQSFQQSLAYLVDIFHALNTLNLQLQGKNINIILHYDIVRSFMSKLDLWQNRIEQGNPASFCNLDSALNSGNLKSELKRQIKTHLFNLKEEFIKYFPDIDEKREAWKFIRNPFQCEVDEIFDEAQEEFLELKFNSTAKDNFKELELEAFWLKCLPVYPLISTQALRVLVMFGSTYLCEAAFSSLVAIKTKYRNKLEVEGDLRCALSGIKPRIKELVAKKQCQVSH